ncbi:TIGR03016 family PEP-CTERM system-associated outer membrane protein [Sneathiella marina]|uniref:TIGR03016 family PEP-CTERM system-associated outer membrane protein n=1 Tax=Sneathiella marina TaxID=2950108 RepID=A0ABY4W6F5_9PROT|nr:TIGR03016 family PEP-CTERM system-associated outer membrane protein [Sneathiella marina]USG61300.1 TIGR03016 family PEP-CTERM system-associated outer membrane protein [Sneathiella marina]
MSSRPSVFGLRSLKASVFSFGLLGSAVVSTSTAVAADWIFTPFVGIREAYTDNVLSTATNTESDFITTLNAGFTLDGIGNRLNILTSYDGAYDIYANTSDLNGFRHNLLGSANAELVQDHFFIDGQIAYTPEDLSTTGASSAIDRTLSNSQTQVLNYSISPYYLQRFGGTAVGIARYRFSQLRFDETDVGGAVDNPGNETTNEVNLILESGRNFSRTSWSLEAFGVDTVVEDGDDLKRGTFVASGQYSINRNVALLGITGYDEFDGENIDNDDISGAFIGAGVRLTPGPRTDLSLGYGYRYGGGIWNMDFSYIVSSAAILTASYVVDVGTGGQAYTNRDVLDEDGELVNTNFSNSDFVGTTTKYETFDVGIRGTRGLNGYSAGATYEKRDFLTANTNDETVSFFGFYSRELSPKLGLSVDGSWSKIIEPETPGEAETTIRAGAALNYRFGDNFTGSLAYNYYDRNADIAADNIKENVISVSLNKSF